MFLSIFKSKLTELIITKISPISNKIKEIQNVAEIFLSPLFKDKKNKKLDVFRYLNLRKATNIKDIALGGINEKNLKRLKLIDPAGFAGISYFEKKKGP